MQKAPSYRELVFSDLVRFRATTRPTWGGEAVRLLSVPGVLASVLLRAQQCLHAARHERLANSLRGVGIALCGLDFGPGAQVGPGLRLEHPQGVVIGVGARIGRDVLMAGGVTLPPATTTTCAPGVSRSSRSSRTASSSVPTPSSWAA